MLNDTIAAISTPFGEGGIGIVRISGDQAFQIINKIFKPKQNKEITKVPGFTMHLGKIHDKNNKLIDEVLVSIMRKPKSFTGEDVIEINCHGGMIPLKLTLEAALEAGARLAEEGEFSKKAFLNGKIDLSQAEAIIDIIRAKNEKGLDSALNQLSGNLAQVIRQIREKVLGLLASVEAAIDFPEEDLGDMTSKEIITTLNTLIIEIEYLISTFEQGKLIREGINTVIIGRTNVGKSSLLNALLKENRSIVTDIPGTTRDTVEEYINLGGFLLKIIDTAGIRETKDLVEQIGVERSKEIIKKADLVLFMLDIADGITKADQEIFSYLLHKRAIILVNKVDLEKNTTRRDEIEKYIKGFPITYISAKNEVGMDSLEKLIVSSVLQGKIKTKNEILITNVRHKEILVRSLKHLSAALKAAEAEIAIDLISIDLRTAWEALGEITGDTTGEDLLDRIFSEFCIGK